MDWHGSAGYGLVWQAGFGSVCCGAVWLVRARHGEVTNDRNGTTNHSMAKAVC